MKSCNFLEFVDPNTVKPALCQIWIIVPKVHGTFAPACTSKFLETRTYQKSHGPGVLIGVTIDIEIDGLSTPTRFG